MEGEGGTGGGWGEWGMGSVRGGVSTGCGRRFGRE